MDNTSFRVLIEKVRAEQEVHQIKLPVPASQLSRVFSKETMDLHYGVLYKNYVKKAHEGAGEFQVAGAKLHTLFFEQMQAVDNTNAPFGEIKDLIEDKFGDYQSFKKEFTEVAINFHGSGWIYLSTTGKIKTIENHKDVSDVAIIVDLWEHSFILDFGANKEKYLKDIWKIINFNTINERLN